MTKRAFDFRALQLDLARQPETVQLIREKIDLIHQFDYNFLFLYLEGRVRTGSFHPFAENASYSGEQIHDLVEYAAGKGIEIIPIVSLFGHAEHFLNVPELEPLAELRGGRMGRFSTRKHVFCPSLPETRQFIEQYVSEITALFPSCYFHAGFDEAWDIGYCERCRKRVETEGQAGIFAEHLNFIHDLVCRKLGKKLMIWDDLFDLYPEAMYQAPKDIILCAWHYDKLVEYPFGHVGGPRTDWFDLYDRLGFQYLFAPATFSFRNIKSFTDYAASKNPLGAFMTMWEEPNASCNPLIAYGGMLWSSRFPEASPELAIKATTAVQDSPTAALLELFLSDRHALLPVTPEGYLHGPLNNAEHDYLLAMRAASGLLARYQNRGDAAITEILTGIELCNLYFELRELFCGLYALKPAADCAVQLAAALEKLRDLHARRRKMEELERPDRVNENALEPFRKLEQMLSELLRNPPCSKALLRVRYPQNSAPFQFSIRYAGDKEWHSLPPAPSAMPFPGERLTEVPFEPQGIPEALQISLAPSYVGGYLMYSEVETTDARYVPLGIADIEGRVSHPEELLSDSRDMAMFGDGEIHAHRKYRNPELRKAYHGVTVLLKKA